MRLADRNEERFQRKKTKSGLILAADVDYDLYCKLPKYAQDNDERKVVYLEATKTLDGTHYKIEYDNEEYYEEYNKKDWLYSIKNRIEL
jgi:hypothetical protein